MYDNEGIETDYIRCAGCGTGVRCRFVYNGGMLPDPGVTLVADWVYHDSCWDLLVRENPVE